MFSSLHQCNFTGSTFQKFYQHSKFSILCNIKVLTRMLQKEILQSKFKIDNAMFERAFNYTSIKGSMFIIFLCYIQILLIEVNMKHYLLL